MIIAIASNDGIKVAEHTGRSCGFVVFEVGQASASRVGYRSNVCAQDSEESEECETNARHDLSADEPYQPLVAVLSDCGALISRGMDDDLVRELHGSAIDAYLCPDDSVDHAAQRFAEGHLQKLP